MWGQGEFRTPHFTPPISPPCVPLSHSSMSHPPILSLPPHVSPPFFCHQTIPKTEPHEKVGVLALEGGRPKVVEYSEITNEMAESRESACGSLLYGASHICVNWFSMAFLRRFCREEIESLPLHVAKKKIPTIDADGAHINPEAPNGIKLELFVFDTFPHARKLVALQASRNSHVFSRAFSRSFSRAFSRAFSHAFSDAF